MELRQLFDPDVSIPDSFRLILKADVALSRPVLQLRLAQVEILNLLIIKNYLQVMVLQGDHITIPLAGRFDHHFRGRRRADHTPTVVGTKLFFAMRIQDLDFEAAPHMILQVAYPHEDAGVPLRIELELQIQYKIPIGTIGGQIIFVARPAVFAQSWF